MGITTDSVMEALAREINCEIIRVTSNGTYTLKPKKPVTWCGVSSTAKILIRLDEKTGVLTSNVFQDMMSEKFYKVARDMWDEYMGIEPKVDGR